MLVRCSSRLAVALGAIGFSDFALPCSAQVAELAKVKPADLAAGDDFGVEVSISGERALIGSHFDDDVGNQSGSAYVFERQASGAWQQTAKLTANDGAVSDFFGAAVALHGDRALIGCWGDDDLGAQSGSVYVFEYQIVGGWQKVAKLTASDAILDDRFGSAIALQGDRALISSPNADPSGASSGAVYVFERQGSGTWLQVAKVSASDGAMNDFFGVSVALDGDLAVIGARGADGPATYTGAAYAFERQGGVWTETAKLTAFDGAQGDFFGISVALDNDVALIGSHQDDDAGASSGSVHVFQRAPTGAWAQTAKLVAAGAAADDEFGKVVSLVGERALIGAAGADGGAVNTGAVYAFRKVGPGAWVQTAKFGAGDGIGTDEFGTSVAVSGDLAIVGAPKEDDAGTNSGAAYVFDLEPLSSAVSSLSLSAGGAQAMDVDAGPAHAGDLYWVLGSVTGTSPGIPLGGSLVLPLVQDGYFLFTLTNPSTGVLQGTFGALGAAGHASAAFAIPPGSDAGLAGAKGYHAFAAISLATLAPVFASNALEVTLVP